MNLMRCINPIYMVGALGVLAFAMLISISRFIGLVDQALAEKLFLSLGILCAYGVAIPYARHLKRRRNAMRKDSMQEYVGITTDENVEQVQHAGPVFLDSPLRKKAYYKTTSPRTGGTSLKRMIKKDATKAKVMMGQGKVTDDYVLSVGLDPDTLICAYVIEDDDQSERSVLFVYPEE